jgi:hypothetical protein
MRSVALSLAALCAARVSVLTVSYTMRFSNSDAHATEMEARVATRSASHLGHT